VAPNPQTTQIFAFFRRLFTAQGYAKRGICRRRVSVCVSVCLRRQMQVGWVRIRHFRRKTSYNSQTVQDRRIVSIKVE